MTATLIDGKKAAYDLKESLKKRVSALKKQGVVPGLAVVLVGDNPASHLYVRNKIRACEAVGISSVRHLLPASVSQEQVMALIETLNASASIHGILLQLPVPDSLTAETLFNTIAPHKDVDGLTEKNMGALARGHPSAFVPCTPKGCVILMKSVLGSLSGQHVAIVGRSHLVGRPLAQLCLYEDCSITVVHSKTSDPARLTREADIVVAAAGVPGLVTASWVKPGATVIDVGINRIQGSGRTPLLVGDVAFEDVSPVAQYLTPVPGGVGPMTVACLLENTVEATEKSLERGAL